MEFPDFFQALAYGAIAVVAMVLGWTVQMVLKLTTAVSTLEANVATLQTASTATTKDSNDTAAKVAEVGQTLAVMLNEQKMFSMLLQEVRTALLLVTAQPPAAPPRAPARKKPA